MTEQWHDIDEQYQISSKWRVRRRHRRHWQYIKPTPHIGYYLSYGTTQYFAATELMGSHTPAGQPDYEWIVATNARDNAERKQLPDIGKRTYSRRAANSTRACNRRPRADMRKCNTCGKPTLQWRCPACWQEINARNGISEDMGHPGDEYGLPW